MSTKPTSHTQRRRPALYWAILELAKVADDWLDLRSAATMPGCHRQIIGDLRRALLAFNDACAGRQTVKQLARVRTAMEHCEVGFRFLQHRDPKMVGEALRRIDQIVATLVRLEALDPSRWLDIEMVPRAAAESDASQATRVKSALHAVPNRASLPRNEIPDGQSPSEAPPHPEQPPPSKAIRAAAGGKGS